MNEKKKIQYFGHNIENLSIQTHNYALTTKQTQSQIHKTKSFRLAYVFIQPI